MNPPLSLYPELVPHVPDLRPTLAARTAGGLYYEIHGHGPPVLFLHGFSTTRKIFYPLIAQLRDRYSIVVPDHRGHGESHALPPPDSLQVLADDTAELARELELPPLPVFGYSMGGAVAQALAIHHPAQVERLVLGATFSQKRQTFREKLAAPLGPLAFRVMGPRGAAALMHPGQPGGPKLPPPTFGWLKGQMRSNPRRQLAAAVRGIMQFDSREHLHQLAEKPVLILTGDRDRIVPPVHAEVLKAYLPHAQVVVLPDGGHTLLYTHTAQLVAELERFLALPRTVAGHAP